MRGKEQKHFKIVNGAIVDHEVTVNLFTWFLYFRRLRALYCKANFPTVGNISKKQNNCHDGLYYRLKNVTIYHVQPPSLKSQKQGTQLAISRVPEEIRKT